MIWIAVERVGASKAALAYTSSTEAGYAALAPPFFFCIFLA